MSLFFIYISNIMMRRFQLIFWLVAISRLGFAQLSTNPSLPINCDAVAITFDSSKETRLGYFTSDLYAHTGVSIEGKGDWQHVIGAWGTAFAWAESLAVSATHTPLVIPIGHTAPWVDPVNPNEFTTPWSMLLDEKKILVIAGFAESIVKQHQRISQIFNSDPYPKFKLEVIKAPLSAGRNSIDADNWFEQLRAMEQQMSKIDFDIALISAGAYSYPLALKAKELGRIGIHCGGGLQLFFGIMGGRWENDSNVLSKQNEYWIRPSRNETPENAKGVEGGCYW